MGEWKSGLVLREISNHWQIKYCWRSRWMWMMGRSGWKVKRAVRGAGAWTDFPTWALSLAHSRSGRPTLEASVCSRHAWVHLCLSTVSLHLLCVYSESAGGGQQTHIPSLMEKITILKKKWKLVFIVVSSRSVTLLSHALEGEAQVTRLIKASWLSKEPSCWLGDCRRGGWGGSRHDKKGRVWLMKMLHVFKSRLAEKRTELLLKKP